MGSTDLDFRDILKGTLDRRRSKNPGYSQRAFARDLGIRPNRLCEILQGKQGISGKWASHIATKLGFDEKKKEHFRTLVAIKHSRSKAARLAASRRLRQIYRDNRYHQLLLSDFEELSQWHALALIELLKTRVDCSDPKALATRLGLDEVSCLDLLHRLEKAELVAKKNDSWTVSKPDNALPEKVPSENIKRFHISLINKAEEAIWEQSLNEREFSSLIVAVDRKKIGAAKERIHRFLKKFDEDFGLESGATDVYCLGVQLYRLSEEEKDG